MAIPDWPAFLLMALALAALAAGAIIEHGQRSESGPIAITPTLQYALAAALVAGFGVAFLRLARGPSVAWWYCVAAFLLVLVLGVWLIGAAGSWAERKKRR